MFQSDIRLSFKNVLPRLWYLMLIKENFINKTTKEYYNFSGDAVFQFNNILNKMNYSPDDGAQKLHGNFCSYCNNDYPFNAKGDHVVNGTIHKKYRELDNLVYRLNCCKSCNSSKLDRDMIDWWINYKKENITKLTKNHLNVKCRDAKIIVVDRQEGFSTSNTQQNNKYCLGKNNDFIIAFSASDGGQIDRLFTRVSTKEPSLNLSNVKSELYDIVKKGPELQVDPRGEKGCMVTKIGTITQYFDLTLFRNEIATMPIDIPYRCIGDDNATSAANLLVDKANVAQDDWQIAVQKLIGIMKNIAIYNPSVNRIDRFGFDVFVFRNDGLVLNCCYTDTTKPEFKLTFDTHDPAVVELMFNKLGENNG